MAKKKRRLSITPERDKSAEDQRLALLAKELGVGMLVVLVNDYGFSRDEANEVLDKVLAQVQSNRALMGVTTALLAKEDEL